MKQRAVKIDWFLFYQNRISGLYKSNYFQFKVPLFLMLFFVVKKIAIWLMNLSYFSREEEEVSIKFLSSWRHFYDRARRNSRLLMWGKNAAGLLWQAQNSSLENVGPINGRIIALGSCCCCCRIAQPQAKLTLFFESLFEFIMALRWPHLSPWE